ncbi:MAG: type 4a pilus biogenesis protein PilO [Planctomycetes bacterium]|nr:type 4a pilus biogenesis protein PilO [Planctomycetota bacterium]
MAAIANDRKLMVLGWLFHLGGLATLVLGAFVYQFIVSGVLTHQQSANATAIAELEVLLETERHTEREFASLQEELVRLEASAEAARQRIPESPQESDFLAQISEAAIEKGLSIQNFTRGEVTVLETHSQLQIRLQGAGDYASVCGFFEKMKTFSRVATVNHLNLQIPANSEIYPLDMTLTLYFGARAPQEGNRG